MTPSVTAKEVRDGAARHLLSRPTSKDRASTDWRAGLYTCTTSHHAVSGSLLPSTLTPELTLEKEFCDICWKLSKPRECARLSRAWYGSMGQSMRSGANDHRAVHDKRQKPRTTAPPEDFSQGVHGSLSVLSSSVHSQP